jgi:hypothetical protein
MKATMMNQKLDFMHIGHIDIYKVEKSQCQLCAYMYNSYNLKSNSTCLPVLQKWTSSEIIMKKFKFFYS